MVARLHAEVLKKNNARSNGAGTQAPRTQGVDCSCAPKKERDPWNTRDLLSSVNSISSTSSNKMEVDNQSAGPAGFKASGSWSISSPVSETETSAPSSTPSPSPPHGAIQEAPAPTEPKPTGWTGWTGALTGTTRETFIRRLRDSCHTTGTLIAGRYPIDPTGRYVASPKRRNGNKGPAKRLAVALDCEMVMTVEGRECVQLCAVDVLTGEEIVDLGVIPIPRITNWSTRWSGMSWPRMMDLKDQGKTVRGWRTARAQLFDFIDEDTVLVGQALENDLKALNIVHQKVVDTALLTKEAVEKAMGGSCSRTWGLKRLAEGLLDLQIQNKKSGHDCMEDTLATREVLLKCLLEPEALEEWAMKAAGVEQARGSPVGDFESWL